MAFTGWPREAFDILQQLEGDPTPSERDAVRRDREQLVRQPMVELLDDLAVRDSAYVDHAVWRYATTVWWWQHQAASIRIDRNVEFGVRFDLDGLHVQGAWYYAQADQRERYRAAVADRRGARLRRILDELGEQSYEIGGDLMKRVPRGYPADHRRSRLLRHRTLIAARGLEPGDWLHDGRAVDRLQEALTQLRPLMEWLSDHVCDPT
jgi:uncharacterized protein (DUF2461 family)